MAHIGTPGWQADDRDDRSDIPMSTPRPPAESARQEAAYRAALAEARRLRAEFAAEFGVRKCRWSRHNLMRMLNRTGEPPARVAELRGLFARLGIGESR